MDLKSADKQLIEDSRILLFEFRKGFVEHLASVKRTTRNNLLHLFKTWQQVNMRRIVDLADSSLDMYNQERLVPACTLARSVFETVGIQYYICKKIIGYTADRDPESIHKLLMSAVFGRRDIEWPEASIQVLTAIDHMNKEFETIREMYDHLCEYAHPNLMGGFGAYAKQADHGLETHFGNNPLKLQMDTWGLSFLHCILMVGSEINNRLCTFHPEFVVMAERYAPNYPL